MPAPLPAQAHAPRVLEARLQAVAPVVTTPSMPDASLARHHSVANTTYSYLTTTQPASPLAIAEASLSAPSMLHTEEARVEPVTVVAQPGQATPKSIYYAIEQLDTPPRILLIRHS